MFFRSKKSLAELATDYEIYPSSLLYRLCDWIGRRTGAIILTPHLTAVGNCAEDVYFGLLKARREGKKLVILWPYELPWKLKFRLTNIEVINVDSEYRATPHNSWLNIVARVLLTVYFAIFRTLSLVRRLLVGVHLNNVYRIPIVGESALWNPERVAEFSWDLVKQYDWPTQLEAPLQVSLTEKKRASAERQRVLMGLPLDAWFICLHVRESGFHNDQYSERNATILNYVSAIEEITSRGGWVVRMGDPTMKKLPCSMERVIDYPFTKAKSALMDVYLISECRFYLGMISGIYDVARLFQRPIIMTNMAIWITGFGIRKGDIGVLKHVYSKSRNQFLTVREWLDEPWDSVAYSHKLGDDYIFHENTPEELRSVVKEYLDRRDDWEPTPLQRKFNEARIQRGRDLLSKRIYFEDDVQLYYRKNVEDYDLVERYRLASRLESAVGMLGAGFLEQNWESSVGSEKLAELSNRFR